MMKLRLRDCLRLRLRAWCPTPPQRRQMGDGGSWEEMAGWLAGPKGKSCVQGGMYHLWLFVFIV